MNAWDDLSERAKWFLANFDELSLAEMLAGAEKAQEPDSHRYLSTGCLHGEHAYCQGKTGAVGAKKPAECKFCGAPCTCPCHAEAEKEPEPWPPTCPANGCKDPLTQYQLHAGKRWHPWCIPGSTVPKPPPPAKADVYDREGRL